LFQELDAFLKKRNCPDFIFIDSIDYLRLTLDEYFFIKEQYGQKRGIVFISHEKNNLPATKIAEKIMYDGKFGFFAKKFVVRQTGKNRCGGMKDYIVSEERARALDPLYFKKLEAEGDDD